MFRKYELELIASANKPILKKFIEFVDKPNIVFQAVNARTTYGLKSHVTRARNRVKRSYS